MEAKTMTTSKILETTCARCGAAGYRADSPDGTGSEYAAPDGETVLCVAPQLDGDLLCDDCYDALVSDVTTSNAAAAALRPRGTYVVNGDAGHLDGWTVATLAAAIRPALSYLWIAVEERPTEFGPGGLHVTDDGLDSEADDLRVQVDQIVARVVANG